MALRASPTQRDRRRRHRVVRAAAPLEQHSQIFRAQLARRASQLRARAQSAPGAAPADDCALYARPSGNGFKFILILNHQYSNRLETFARNYASLFCLINMSHNHYYIRKIYSVGKGCMLIISCIKRGLYPLFCDVLVFDLGKNSREGA